jgi:hypothetical protein
MSIRVQWSMGNRYDGISTRSPRHHIFNNVPRIFNDAQHTLKESREIQVPSFAECFWSFAKLKEFHFKQLWVYMEAC